jgi:hypothetical protein
MLALLVVAIVTGWLSQYGQLPTDATIAYRQQVGDIPYDLSEYAGVIAVEDCAKVGHDAWLSVNDGSWMKVIVFDCLGRHEHNWMQERNVIAEMGYYLTAELDLLGEGGIAGALTYTEPLPFILEGCNMDVVMSFMAKVC